MICKKQNPEQLTFLKLKIYFFKLKYINTFCNKDYKDTKTKKEREKHVSNFASQSGPITISHLNTALNYLVKLDFCKS